MGSFDLEDIDLLALVRHLKDTVGDSAAGAVVGKTRFRDGIAAYLGCSELDAERLVDTMVSRGYLVKETAADGPSFWTLAVDKDV